MDKIIEDDELGRLVIRVNSRARSLVFRTKSDAVYVSVPPGTTLKEVKQAIENLRGKLLASRQKIARPLIDLNYKIDADWENQSYNSLNTSSEILKDYQSPSSKLRFLEDTAVLMSDIRSH